MSLRVSPQRKKSRCSKPKKQKGHVVATRTLRALLHFATTAKRADFGKQSPRNMRLLSQRTACSAISFLVGTKQSPVAMVKSPLFGDCFEIIWAGKPQSTRRNDMGSYQYLAILRSHIRKR